MNLFKYGKTNFFYVDIYPAYVQFFYLFAVALSTLSRIHRILKSPEIPTLK